MLRLKVNGFTLIEMIIVVALLAIFLALAVPNFSSFVRDNRLQAAAGNVRSLAEFARMEAATRGGQTNFAISGSLITVSYNVDLVKKFDLPSGVSISKSADSTSFSLNGGASKALALILCERDDASSAYKVVIERSGRVRVSSRGRDESGKALVSCTL
ncbi:MULTISPECIES: pilus assembly FimT family protein [Pseudomonadaceae]|jgi:type IV fimbrial biogenesis protein FimU|uniref:pilus assembly FimT family protein n=1 Tax=Pseudomonadaceae TaxID=135621 RepID=UPI0009E1B077|nr:MULTISPECIES: GspH/FimT family pseudopilin [Pseudomonas]MBO2929635.1 prepilin-type N-terminal cleavage/methylation domain-containing protein [Pseudomonas otitidis]